MQNNYTSIPPGIWRATLDLGDRESTRLDNGDLTGEERSGAILPFLFEVIYEQPDSFYLVIRNAEERIVVNDIQWGRDIATGRDTIRIDFPVLDSHISAGYEEDHIEGRWYQHYRGSQYWIPFRAEHGRNQRFDFVTEKPVAEFSGKWKVTMSVEKDSTQRSTLIGDFSQVGDSVTGTFLSKTGDYRFLEGKASGQHLFLSCFDGGHAYLFEAKLQPDGSLSGIYRSGNHYKTYWTAIPEENGSMPDADTLTRVTDQDAIIDFSLPNPDGRMISPMGPEYRDKALLLQIMGTWCVNCLDETLFLKEYLKNNPEQDVNVIALSFERYRDSTRAMQAVRTFREELEIPYEVVLAGYYDKGEASSFFPMLNRVIAYPTMIFLDSEKKIHKIHTGFSGPATEGYSDFKKSFSETVSTLINQE